MTETEHTESGGVDVAVLRELLAEATETPWKTYADPPLDGIVFDQYGLGVQSEASHDVVCYSGQVYSRDAALIAAAVNALPALLDELESAHERVRVVEGERDAEVAEAEREMDKTLAIMEAACDRSDAATLRAESAEAAHRDLVSRLGFGDNITEPMADNDAIVAWFDQQGRDASEWQESQLWRNDCYAKGHPDDDDCYECDPALRLSSAEAALASLRGGVEGLAEEATQRAYMQIATEQMLTVCTVSGDTTRALVPGHWRDESEAAASVTVADLRALLAADVTTVGVSGERVEGEM